jgi:AcrR family transcriptional regulator
VRCLTFTSWTWFPHRTGGSESDRLVAGAARLLYQRGAEKTTLVDIAEVAKFPPRNVYYYFKTKDDIVAAEEQFRQMGRPDAHDLAVTLLSCYEAAPYSPTPFAMRAFRSARLVVSTDGSTRCERAVRRL